MKDTTAYTIIQTLKAQGHKVKCQEAPCFHKSAREYGDGSENMAVVGVKPMTPEAIEACVETVREMVGFEGLAIDKSGNCKHFPDAAFAAW